MEERHETIIEIKNKDNASLFTRQYLKDLELIENKFHVKLNIRGNILTIKGASSSDIIKAKNLINNIIGNYLSVKLTGKELDRLIERFLKDPSSDENFKEKIEVWASRKKFIYPKTKGQLKYVKAIRKNDITICYGPAGTGKTYLAMALAIEYLKKEIVSRIILTRPAVEAGETLGFLPGDMKEKLLPYLRPLYDALFEMIEPEKVENLIERGIIEIAPLAYIRGRTLNDSFIILDEAQNASSMQMKMFLTRLGFNSKIAITGDITQIDLKKNIKSGLIEIKNILSNIPGISIIQLTDKDIIRHPLVQEIINAYNKIKEKNEV